VGEHRHNDHGVARQNTIEADGEGAQWVFADLEALGVQFDCVTWQLENEGMQKFIEPYDALMGVLHADPAQPRTEAH
jgi:hypothetical protein